MIYYIITITIKLHKMDHDKTSKKNNTDTYCFIETTHNKNLVVFLQRLTPNFYPICKQ